MTRLGLDGLHVGVGAVRGRLVLGLLVLHGVDDLIIGRRDGRARLGRATRGELPERVARRADCRALFRADTIAGVFASRRTFCWTRTASTGAAAFATMAVRRAVLPERAATRAGSAILQV